MVYLSVSMSLITVSNPLTTIYFVKPYRRVIVRAVKKATSAIASVSSRIHPHAANAAVDQSSTGGSYQVHGDDEPPIA